MKQRFKSYGELADYKGQWKKAKVVFDISKNIKEGNWKERNYTKEDATYIFDSSANYFQEGKISNSIFGECKSDGEYINLSLYYQWIIDYIEIIE